MNNSQCIECLRRRESGQLDLKFAQNLECFYINFYFFEFLLQNDVFLVQECI